MGKATKRIIMVKYGSVRKLAKAFGVSESCISQALRGHKNGANAKKIRHVALTQFEGVEMAPADKSE